MMFGLDESQMPSFMDSASLPAHIFQSKQEILSAKLQGGQPMQQPAMQSGMQSQLNNPSVWQKTQGESK